MSIKHSLLTPELEWFGLLRQAGQWFGQAQQKTKPEVDNWSRADQMHSHWRMTCLALKYMLWIRQTLLDTMSNETESNQIKLQ